MSRHAEADPTLAHRYGPRWRGHWVDDLHTRLLMLAQAVAFNRAELFTANVGWSRAAFHAREVGPDDLRNSVNAMRAVLADELPEAAAAPALACVDAALAGPLESPAPTLAPPPAVSPDLPHGRLALRYLEALLEGDRRRAEGLVLEAAASAAVSVADLYLHVLAPAMTEVGNMWHMNEITVADEHFAMMVTESLMARLRPYFPDVPATGHTMIATSISGDQHALGVRMVADFFEMAGWNAVCLGASTPADDVLEYLAHRDADLLAVSVTNPLFLRALAELIETIRAIDNLAHTPVMVGGGPFLAIPDLWRDVGADGSARSAREAVEIAARLVTPSG